MPAHRSVIRDEGFESGFRGLFSNWAEADAFLAPAEALLAEDAEIGTLHRDGIWVLPMASVRGATIYLHYIFYETVVVLLELEAFL